MPDDLGSRILECLDEKPMSISEIARELDEKKYTISKKIEVLEEQGHINTHRIGRSTACILNDNPSLDDRPDLLDREPDEDLAAEADSGPEDDNSLDFGNDPIDQKPPAPQSAALQEFAGGVQETGDLSRPPAGKTRPRSIGIVSGKGGVGKTVVSLNLGAALLEMDENVIVIDSDAEMSNLGIHLGMHTHPTSLSHVVEKDLHIMSAMHIHHDSGLKIIPTSLAAEAPDTDIKQAFKKIPEHYTVLVDSPPGFKRPLNRVIDTCDELIFVTTPEIPAVTDTYKLYKEARRRGANALGVVVNMYDNPKHHLSTAEVEEALELPVIGTVERSDHVPKSIFENQPVVSHKPHAKVSRSFKKIAADLTGEDYDVSLIDRLKGLLS